MEGWRDGGMEVSHVPKHVLRESSPSSHFQRSLNVIPAVLRSLINNPFFRGSLPCIGTDIFAGLAEWP